jgi:hypothetical protein
MIMYDHVYYEQKYINHAPSRSRLKGLPLSRVAGGPEAHHSAHKAARAEEGLPRPHVYVYNTNITVFI